MITHFKCKKTEKIFNQEFVRELPREIQRIAMKKLWMLDSALSVVDLKSPPANRLKKLEGSSNCYSIRINRQWRICFLWENGNAMKVEIIDYH